MRKERRHLLLAVLAAVALVTGLVWLIFRNQEPVYKGKRLSDWLHEDNAADGALNSNVQDAFRQIGTNAIPTLLRMLRAHDSRFKLALMGLAQKQHFINITFVRAEDRNVEAMLGFSWLMSSASNAVPTLIQIYGEKISYMSRISTVNSLGLIGPAASQSVPVLVRNLGNTNTNPMERAAAAQALGLIHAEPELAVPALIKCLNPSESIVKRFAARGLERFGKDAKAAVPALLETMNDPDPEVETRAEHALQAIDPEAAAKAGVK